MERIMSLLRNLYEEGGWESLWDDYYSRWKTKSKSMHAQWEQRDKVMNEGLAMLITYGDSIKDDDSSSSAPLATLYRFLDEMTEGTITGVHVLPFFPYTSDDGFSISDYRKVREDLGSWSDIEKIADDYHFMSDLVLNHCSSKHEWFSAFLAQEEKYKDFFVTGDPHADYSKVVRPRPHFVLSEYDTKKGTRHVWTTFSRDQVDINFANPLVLFEMLDIMVLYVLEHKSRLIRLDAIAYLWKEMGTSCIHHPKTHIVVKIMRALLEDLAPDTIIISETNVPHKENISYFGENEDEAQMIYQFPLPPLLLHAMITGQSRYLQQWASTLPQPTAQASYFNFCASHDGIGLTPTHGILSDEERNDIIETVKKRGGLVSYKATADGKIPYELNVNYLSVIAPHDIPDSERAKIFLISQSVLLCMAGVPGIYIHSLLGSENWNHGVKISGHNRSINRQQLQYERVVQEIETEGSLRHEVFYGYLSLLKARAKSGAFHPASPMHILSVEDGVFALIRETNDGKEKVFCIANFTSREVEQIFDKSLLPWEQGGEDLVNGDIVFLSQEYRKGSSSPVVSLILEPYEFLWLRFTR